MSSFDKPSFVKQIDHVKSKKQCSSKIFGQMVVLLIRHMWSADVIYGSPLAILTIPRDADRTTSMPAVAPHFFGIDA